jgi:hypothetical protein
MQFLDFHRIVFVPISPYIFNLPRHFTIVRLQNVPSNCLKYSISLVLATNVDIWDQDTMRREQQKDVEMCLMGWEITQDISRRLCLRMTVRFPRHRNEESPKCKRSRWSKASKWNRSGIWLRELGWTDEIPALDDGRGRRRWSWVGALWSWTSNTKQ